NGHFVRIRVVPSSARYAFDWDDRTGGELTVDLYTPGPSSTLRLNTIAPDSLLSAIDAFKGRTGQAPRLQVISQSTVINDPIRVVDYASVSGKTTLTLEPLPATWAPPAIGDAVFSYGPAVATLAARVRDLCDSLGPSRRSGFGDRISPWPARL